MIKIGLHGGNFTVTAEGTELMRLGSILRQHLGDNVSRLSGGHYSIQPRASVTLLQILGSAEWDEEAKQLAEKYRLHYMMQMQARIEVDFALQYPQIALNNYTLLPKLDPHQAEAVAAISTPSLRGLALWDEQGTGKTITALCSFDRLRQLGVVERLLVIAPKSVLGAWDKDARTIFENQIRVTMVHGESSKRKKLWQQSHDIILCGYETAVADQERLHFLVSQKPNRYMLVLDESYYVKNQGTRRSEVVAEIRPYFERAVVLCGTPAPNSPLDLVNQINLADSGVAMNGRSLPDAEESFEFVEDILKDTIYLRRLKEDVMPSIPSKEFEILKIQMSPIQRDMYENVLNDLVLSVRELDDQAFLRQLSHFMARRSALLQICSHPAAIDPGYNETPAKLLALDMLLKKLIEDQGEKVLIWSYYRYSIEQIAARYSKYGLVRIDGTVTKLEERVKAVKSFQEDPNIHIFLGNAAAAGAGITLTASHHAIYESLSNQAVHWLQSIDRIHRRGQYHQVNCQILIVDQTLEEHEFERIKQKEQDARDLLHDEDVEPITKETFLRDLHYNKLLLK